MNGRKIPKKYENPIDNILIEIADKITPLLNNMKVTPNMVTGLSLLLGISSGVSMYYDKYKLAAILNFLAYFFDCVDGHLARKFDMVTVFGDYFDHYADLVKFGIILYMFYIKRKKKLFKIIIPILILILLMLIHFGCQESVYGIDDGPFLSFTKNFCPVDSLIKFTRFFGTGTLSLVLSYIIFTYDK